LRLTMIVGIIEDLERRLSGPAASQRSVPGDGVTHAAIVCYVIG
jgi:hypothetical protein